MNNIKLLSILSEGCLIKLHSNCLNYKLSTKILLLHYLFLT